MEEDPRYLTEQIVTYLGNKRSLLHFLGMGLEQVKSRLGKDRLKAGDLFSGSGIVARFLKKHSEELIVNDLEEYSRIVNTCYLSNPEEVENLELERHYRRLLRYMETHESPGFITELYAPKIRTASRRKTAFFIRAATPCTWIRPGRPSICFRKR